MPRKPDSPCAGGCGKLLWQGTGSKPKGERLCRECRASNRVRLCARCGAPFQVDTPGRPNKYCSRECYAILLVEFNKSRRVWANDAEREAAKCRRRRAVKRGLPSEQYGILDIALRDGFDCSLCGEMIDFSLPPTDRMSPTVDHVIPISKGGPDLLSNVRLAHRVCNSIKGVS